MANKIKLGQRPESFKKTVEFIMIDGDKAEIEMVFKYRTRKEFGEFFDKTFAVGDEPSGKRVSDADYMSSMMNAGGEKNATYILDIATGWNLDIPFSRENIEQMCDEMPAAAVAIMQGYYSAVTEGRLKN